MLRRHCSFALVLVTAALATALTACATPESGGPPEPDAPRSTDTPAVSRSDLVVPTSEKPPSSITTLTGQVEEGVEAGCTVLRTGDGSTFTLVGRIDGLVGTPGPVTLRGRLDPDLMSHCMQGPIFVVEGVEGVEGVKTG